MNANEQRTFSVDLITLPTKYHWIILSAGQEDKEKQNRTSTFFRYLSNTQPVIPKAMLTNNPSLGKADPGDSLRPEAQSRIALAWKRTALRSPLKATV